MIINQLKGNKHQIARAYWAGDTLSQAAKRLVKHKAIPVDEIINEWRSIRRADNAGKLALWPPRKKKVSTDPEYLAWKGEIGPGAKLRQIIAICTNNN